MSVMAASHQMVKAQAYASLIFGPVPPSHKSRSAWRSSRWALFTSWQSTLSSVSSSASANKADALTLKAPAPMARLQALSSGASGGGCGAESGNIKFFKYFC